MVVVAAMACSSNESTTFDSATASEARATSAAASTPPTASVEETAAPAAQSEPEPPEPAPAVPFPPPENLVEFDDIGELGVPPTLADLYELEPVDDFVVYDDGNRSVAMTEAFRKEGRTYGYVTWTVDGRTHSTSSRASHELATCAADRLAVTLDRFEAELLARGANVDDDSPVPLDLVLDIYVECGGTDELLTSFRDELFLDSGPFDVACVTATVTTPEHLRIVRITEPKPDDLDRFADLMGPCFRWSFLEFEPSASSRECLDARRTSLLRSLVADNDADFIAVLEICVSPDELAQIMGG